MPKKVFGPFFQYFLSLIFFLPIKFKDNIGPDNASYPVAKIILSNFNSSFLVLIPFFVIFIIGFVFKSISRTFFLLNVSK